MEAEDGDADNIFDLGEDDEDDGGSPTVVPVAREVEDGDPDGEGVMESDPYNPDDWDDALAGAEAEEDTSSALLFDEDSGNEGGIGDAGDIHDDDDLHSLMDRGLEEVDDLLCKKGRLSAEIANTGNFRPSPAAEPDVGLSVTAQEGLSVAASGGGREQPERDDDGSTSPDFTQTPQHRSARGAGANAASVLMSATAPTSSGGEVSASSFLDPDSTKQEPSGSSSAAAINGERKALHSDGQATRGGVGVTRLKEGVRSYVYEAAALHGGVNAADHLYSPPRRREKEAIPFIKAKGLTLTRAQVKLFGLAGSAHPAVLRVTKSDSKKSVTWTGSGSQPQTTGGTNRRTGPGGSTRDVGHRKHHSIPRRAFSPSRMEQLSNPVPGRGRFDDSSCIGGGKSADDRPREGNGGGGGHGGGSKGAPFTWKRSRKAEAALRDPACGYDFVREAGYTREDFLARTEAYTSYSRQKLETRRGEDHYAARVDKLECPRCHNPQSYDEFVSKKPKCGGCDVAYCVPRAWNRRVWERRNELCMAKSEERKARIEREAEEEFLRRMPKQTRHAALLRQRVGQVGFIRRMRRDLERRRAREAGALTGSHDNQDDGEERYTDRQGKGSSGRPASAPATTNRSRRVKVARGTTGTPDGKKRGASEGRRTGEGEQSGGARNPPPNAACAAGSTHC